MSKSRKIFAAFVAILAAPAFTISYLFSMHLLIFACFMLLGPKDEKLDGAIGRAGRWWLNMSLAALGGVILMSLLR